MNDELLNGSAETRQLLRGLAGLGEVRAPAPLLPAVLRQTGLADGYWRVASAIGDIFVAYNERGVSAVMRADSAVQFEANFRAHFGRPAVASAGASDGAFIGSSTAGSSSGQAEALAELAAAVRAQLAGERAGELRFDLRGLSEFEQAVLRKALEIPRGEVRPYAWIAAEIGHPQAVRAVGTALGRNPVPLLIPCHRVVRSDGRTGNYVFGGPAKCALLATEGVRPDELERLAAAGIRYYGSDTTHIFCYPTCRHARRITDQHRVAFKSGGQALAAGYRPCKVCRPAEFRDKARV